MTTTQETRLRDEASAARTKAFVWPAALAVVLFAAIVFIQFSLILGPSGFIAEFPLAVGFYYCYAWAKRRLARANAMPGAGKS